MTASSALTAGVSVPSPAAEMALASHRGAYAVRPTALAAFDRYSTGRDIAESSCICGAEVSGVNTGTAQ